MNSFEIFVDSAANLTDELIEKYNIGVVSYTCSIDGKEMECYEKGVDYNQTAKTFYEAMEQGAETKTTLVNADKIIDAVTPVLKEGKDILFFTISSKLSGTFNQANEAKRRLQETFPDRKFLVADSYNASMGEGLLAVYAGQHRDKGESIEDVAKWVEDNKLYLNSFATVANLKYLKKGGRIGMATAIVGNILNIKPVLWGSEEGVLDVLCNERGRKKALTKMADCFKNRVVDPENQIVAITHANCLDDAQTLAEMVKSAGAKEVVLNMYDLCTGAHIGPGTIALFFLGKKRISKKDV